MSEKTVLETCNRKTGRGRQQERSKGGKGQKHGGKKRSQRQRERNGLANHTTPGMGGWRCE